MKQRNTTHENMGNKNVTAMVDLMLAYMLANPKDNLVSYELGHTLYWLERHEDALSAWTYTLKINPKEASAFINAGISLELLGRYELAIKHYEKAAKIFPDHRYPILAKALLYRNLYRFKDALALFKKANSLSLMMSGEAPPLEAMEGRIYNCVGELKKSDTMFNLALNKYPKNHYIYEEMIISYWQRANYEKYHAALKSLSVKYPKDRLTIYHNMAKKMNYGDYKAALLDAKLLDNFSGNLAPLIKLKADLQLAMGFLGEASKTIKRLSKKNSIDPGVLRLQASLAVKQERWADAVKYLILQIKLTPRDAVALTELAKVYAIAKDPKVKNVKRCRDLLKHIKELQDNLYYYGKLKNVKAEILLRQSYIYEALNQSKDAKAALEEFLSIRKWDTKQAVRLKAIKEK